MKVLLDAHMLSQNETGIERYWSNLIHHLAQSSKNLRLHLYCNLPQMSIKQDGTYPVFIPPIQNGFYRLLFGFDQAIRKFKPDIIHVSTFAPVMKTIPTVITIHDLCIKNYPETFSLKSHLVFNFFLGRSIHQADAIICVSHAVKKNIIKFYPINPDKIHVIYEAADPIFKFIPDKRKVKIILKEKFNITHDFFLVVGNIQKRKNPFQIIDVFTHLLRKNENLQLVFAGPNKVDKVFQSRYNDLILSGHLKLLGYVADTELNLLYNSAVALIFNSVCEGFGLPLVEAMSCKTPVICNDIEVFREIADEAVIFTKHQKGLYLAMQKIISNNNFRNKYANLGYFKSKIYTWESTTKEALKIYKNVLNQLDKKNITL